MNASQEPDSEDAADLPRDAAQMSEFEKALALASGANNPQPYRSFARGNGAKAKLMGADEELSMRAIRARDRKQDISLKKLLARFAIGALTVQLVVADVVFWKYLDRINFEVSDSVMIAWLSATVIEVIGIVAIIARNLFPNRGETRPKKPASS